MLKHVFFSIFSLLLLYTNAQNYELGSQWKVLQNGDTLLNAWGGAMNAPQFGEIDLDLDGYNDLIFFDREDNSFNTYLKKVTPAGVKYVYTSAYSNIFNKCDCKQWAIVTDYTCDGKADILCGDIYSNAHGWKQRIVNGNVTFKPEYLPAVVSEYNASPNGKFDLFSTGIDYPALADMDFDGDLDFLTFGNASNFIEWHRNMAMERMGRCDTLIFKLDTYCWGHYYENGQNCSPVIHDTTNCPLPRYSPEPPKGDNTRHTGSTILVVNLDADSLNDLIIGDVSCASVYALNNKGSRAHAYVETVENMYPMADVSVNDSIFPATFFMDVNNDNIKDFLVAPNSRVAINNFEGVQYYKNVNSNNHLVPDFQSVGWLQNTNLEFGSWAAPVFFDYNSDGLMDLLVANNYYATGNKTWNAWALLKNIGTAIKPVYEVVTKDYMDWVANNPYPTLRAMTPAFADLDGDNDQDLFVGNYDGTLYYFRNDAVPNGVANFQFVTDMLDSIDVGFHSAPTFYDIDNDGDKDLFVGDKKGYTSFFENVSVGSNIDFNLITTKWGNIKIDDELVANTDGYVRPYFMDYNDDGTTEFMAATTYGKIRMYHNISANPVDTLSLIGTLFNMDFGSHASLAAAKLDSSSAWSFVVGNGRGGLMLVAVNSDGQSGVGNTPIQNELHFELFPNPTKDNIVLTFPDNYKGIKYISVVNVLGQEMLQTTASGDRTEISLAGMAAGFYYVKITEGDGKMGIRKVYKQ